jgi:acyl carrier protein
LQTESDPGIEKTLLAVLRMTMEDQVRPSRLAGAPDADVLAARVEALGFDSAETLVVLMELEDRIGRYIDEQAFIDCVTVAEWVDLLILEPVH